MQLFLFFSTWLPHYFYLHLFLMTCLEQKTRNYGIFSHPNANVAVSIGTCKEHRVLKIYRRALDTTPLLFFFSSNNIIWFISLRDPRQLSISNLITSYDSEHILIANETIINRLCLTLFIQFIDTACFLEIGFSSYSLIAIM